MSDLMVQILFSGLIAFSPAAEDTVNTVSTALVLNDVSNPMMPHGAFMIIQSGKLIENESGLGFDDDFSDPDFSPSPKAYIGSGYSLAVEGLAPADPRYHRCRELVPRFNEAKKVACLLKASELRDLGHKPTSNSLTGDTFSDAKNVALRFVSNVGTLRPFEKDPLLQGEINARAVKWSYPLGYNREQYVPELMEWVSPSLGAASGVTLVLATIGGDDIRKVRIEREGNAPIRILISNAPDSRDICSEGYSRYRVMHLERLARFANFELGPENGATVPMLSDFRDIEQVDAACHAMGMTGGRQPIICYGSQMP